MHADHGRALHWQRREGPDAAQGIPREAGEQHAAQHLSEGPGPGEARQAAPARRQEPCGERGWHRVESHHGGERRRGERHEPPPARRVCEQRLRNPVQAPEAVAEAPGQAEPARPSPRRRGAEQREQPRYGEQQHQHRMKRGQGEGREQPEGERRGESPTRRQSGKPGEEAGDRVRWREPFPSARRGPSPPPRGLGLVARAASGRRGGGDGARDRAARARPEGAAAHPILASHGKATSIQSTSAVISPVAMSTHISRPEANCATLTVPQELIWSRLLWRPSRLSGRP
ncbi:hypothetical protein ROTAS13_02094 [Roseomonas sp. TAS13]|nr:hypothetical protein ROTAS13_02094 [Roseomonas sp. TAS13]